MANEITAYFHSNDQAYFDDVDFSKTDYVIFFACTISGYTEDPDTVTLSVYHSGAYVADLVTRVHAAGKLVSMALLNASAANNTILSDAGLRAELVSEISSLVTTYSLDGFDIDWEAGQAQNDIDQLIIDLKAEITPKRVTAAVNGETCNIGVECDGSIDAIHVMAYDMWQGVGYPYHAAYEEAVDAVQLYITEGFAASKIFMGIPFYGRDAGTGYWDYSAIYDAITPPPSQNTYETAGPFLGQAVSGGVIWWNGPDYIENKIDYLKENSFAGAMIYQLGEDKYDANALLGVIYAKFQETLPVRYEAHNTYDINDNFRGIYWKAQTFTPDTTHRVTQVKLFLYRAAGTPAGNLDVVIKAVDGAHKPTGAALCSGSIPISDISTDPGGIYTIGLGVGAILTATVEYAIVFSAPSESINIYSYGDTAGGYADGVLWYSGDSGSSWSAEVDMDDAWFEEWGLDTPLPAETAWGGSGVLIGTATTIFGAP